MMFGSDERDLIWRYYLFRLTNSSGFYVPISVLYLQSQGFGLGFVGLAYGIHSLAAVAAEIPTGYLGDRVGRRGSLAIGSALRAIALGSYAIVDTGTAFLVLHVVWATGRAFRSGTIAAWLYELLAARGETDEYARVEGRGSTVYLVTSAVTALAGAALFTRSPMLPFLANAGLIALGIPLLATFPRVKPEASEKGTFTVREAVAMLRLQLRRPAVRWFVVYVAVFNALYLVGRIYTQPAWTTVGLPVAGLGLLYAAFNFVSAGAASGSGWVQDRLGAKAVFALMVPLYGVVYGAVTFLPLLVIPVLFLTRAGRVITRPIQNQYLNDHLDDVGRATVLSGASMVFALVGGVARIGAGPVAEATGPVTLLALSGVFTAVVGGVIFLSCSPIRIPNAGSTSVSEEALSTD